jgi:hypothetical protein
VLVIICLAELAMRGVGSPGLLVGLGGSLSAWGIVAVVALLTDCARWVLSRRTAISAALPEKKGRELRRLVYWSVAGSVVMKLGFAFLETRPLPHLPNRQRAAPADVADDESRAPLWINPASDAPGRRVSNFGK